MKFTPEQQERRNSIREAELAIAEAKEKLRLLVCGCKHVFPELTPKQLKDEWMSETAYCKVCERSFGCRCKKSPDSVCHYHSKNGQVKMLDGTLVPVPEGYDPEGEDFLGEWCIFCGLPKDRD